MQFNDVEFADTPTSASMEQWFTETSFSDHMKSLVPQAYQYLDHFYRAKAFLNRPIGEQIPPFKVRVGLRALCLNFGSVTLSRPG